MKLLELVTRFQSLLAMLLTWAGVLWVWYRSRSNWARKAFIRQVNFSLNLIDDGTLLLRTLREAQAREVWLSDHAADKVIDAAKHTTEAHPFLVVKDAEDLGFVQRSVVNMVSEMFGTAYLAQAVGKAVKRETFVFGVTYEQYGNIRTRKLRVMLLAENLLKQWFVPGAPQSPDGLKTVSQAHKDRITTLKEMGRLYASSQERERNLLATVEVVVPL